MTGSINPLLPIMWGYSMLSRDDFQIKRSPARVSWHILFRGVFIEARDTKAAAAERIEELRKVA